MSPRQFASFGLLLLAAARLQGLVVDSSISAVTVYSDRAQVTRSAPVAIAKPGTVELEFTGLPLNLNEQSLRVTGSGTAKVSILDVSSRNEHLSTATNERFRALEEELAGYAREQRRLDDREKLHNEQQAYLGQIRAASVAAQPEGQKRPDVEEWTRLLAFNSEQLTALTASRQQLADEREALQRKVDLAQRQLNELRGNRGKTVKRVIVRIDAASAGDLALNLGYTLPGAAWMPTYDTRLNTEARAVNLSYFGLVRNGTGEDWSNVTLTLSTARPNLGGGAPEIAPWFVDVYQPRPAPAARAQAMNEEADAFARKKSAIGSADKGFGTGNVLALLDAPAAPAVFAAEQAQAHVDASLTSATFKLSAPVSLRSDNSSQKVPIASFTLPAKLQYQATPKLRETAFLAAYVTNSSEYPLLPGVSNIFLDDSFIASGHLKTVMPGEKFDLALGADESVAIKRRLVNRFSETVGLTSKTQRITYEIALTLTNNRKSTERLVLTEVLPVSRNEKIEVSLLTPASREVGTKEAPKELTREEDGKLVWRIDLKAGEKRELTLKFQVEHPVDLPVVGLE